MSLTRKMVLGSNWKIYISSRREAESYTRKLKQTLTAYDTSVVEAYILPDFLNLETVRCALDGFPVSLGAQDVFWEDSGAFTGEVSPLLLKEAGCKYVMLGHSERRSFFGESDKNVNKKVLACYRNGMVPLLLIGETAEEREEGRTLDVVRAQLRICLNGVPAGFLKELVIMYEPRWAIGRSDAASPEIIEMSHRMVRSCIEELYDTEPAKSIRIIYGGSVNLENADRILSIPDVDGLGITRASLDPVSFAGFIRITEKEAKKRSAV
jgi:triosephosphate isomerase